MARALVTANDSENRLRVWLSTWLSSTPNLAGMDGNRTHPGRLSSAPQTVLKTAGLSSATVHRHAYTFGNRHRQSVFIRSRLPRSAVLAVLLAVSDAARVVGHLIPQVHGSSPCASTKNVVSRCFKGTLPEG